MLPDFSFDITNKVMSIRNQVNYLESSRAILGVSDSLSKIYKSANIGAMHTLKSFNDAENVRKLSGVSSLEGIAKMFETYTAIMPKFSENILIDKPLLSIADIYQSVNFDGMYKLTENFLKMYKPLKFDTYGFEETFSELHQRINEMVQAIPDEDYDVLLKDTEYTKDDVLEELDVFVQTEINTPNEYFLIWHDESLAPDEKIGKLLHLLYKQYPVLGWLILFVVVFTKACDIGECYNENVSPMIESAIVALEGKQDIYFVYEENGARLYKHADTKSDVLIYIDFTEQVKVIGEVNFWWQISYIDEDRNEITGWIAKRNLVSYKDMQFNSDYSYKK